MGPRRILWAAVAVALVAFGAILLWRMGQTPSAPAQNPVASQGRAAVGGPFTLTNQDGRRVSQDILTGKWSVVFFGFTYCPDICPTTLQVLNQAIDQLGPGGAGLQVVFVTVDPERDTPEQLRQYLSGTGMPRNVVGLTGTPAEVAAAARAYRVYYQRRGEGEGYTMDHSTAAYLMNPRGEFVRVLAYGLTPEETARQIREAMREG